MTVSLLAKDAGKGESVSEPSSGEPVTFKQLLTSGIVLFTGIGGLFFAALEFHESRPHKGAVEHREFDQHREDTREDIRDIKTELRSMNGKLDEVLRKK